MYKIKTNTPPRIFAYHLQTINPKYATRYSRKISKRQRERERQIVVMPNISFMRVVRLFGTAY